MAIALLLWSRYKDDSNEILKSIGVEEKEESDSDSNMVNVEWDNADGIRTLKEKVESVNFPVGEDKEYKEDSNEISKSINV